MNSWWHPNNWWSPDKIRNPKAYILHVFFSTKGRINVETWFVCWLLLTIIWFYFLDQYFWVQGWNRCDHLYHRYNDSNPAYEACRNAADAEFYSGFMQHLVVWLLLLYPYCAISIKRFHDIDEGKGGEYLLYCIIGIIAFYMGIVAYFYYMVVGKRNPQANRFGKSLMSFRSIWDYESTEIKTAIGWEEMHGYAEAIAIYANLSRAGDVSRLEKIHIEYLRNIYFSKLSTLKEKGIDCTGLEISTAELNSKMAKDYNVKDGKSQT